MNVGQTRLGVLQSLLALFIQRLEISVVVCGDYGGIIDVADDGFDVFVLGVLLQILEFQFAKEALQAASQRESREGGCTHYLRCHICRDDVGIPQICVLQVEPFEFLILSIVEVVNFVNESDVGLFKGILESLRPRQRRVVVHDGCGRGRVCHVRRVCKFPPTNLFEVQARIVVSTWCLLSTCE